MKLTTARLRKIIKEELQATLREEGMRPSAGLKRHIAKMPKKLDLRQYIRQILREGAMILPQKLYHATYGPLIPSIMNAGLGGNRETVWEDSQSGVVYLAVDPAIASGYAEESDMAWDRYEDETGSLDIVTFEIDTSMLDATKFKIDQNVIDNTGDTLEYHGIIPPSALKIIDRYEA